MGGCGLFFLLVPLLMGFGIVLAFFAVALPLYAVGAILLAIAIGVAYALLVRYGLFKRYLAETGWRRTLALVLQWSMRVALPVLLVSAAAAIAFWLFYFRGMGQ